MAASSFITNQYSSSQFVESAGAVLFSTTTTTPDGRICLLHNLSSGEWLLAKGRRNVNETHQAAAVREVTEETGFRCRLLPLKMETRAPAANEDADIEDKARVYEGITEPFMVSVRELGNGSVKFIWWFVAIVVLQPDEEPDSLGAESGFSSRFLRFDEALERLTFETDREVVRRAILILGDQGD